MIHYILCTKSGLQGTWSAKCPLLVHCGPVHGPLVCMVWSADYIQPFISRKISCGLEDCSSNLYFFILFFIIEEEKHMNFPSINLKFSGLFAFFLFFLFFFFFSVAVKIDLDMSAGLNIKCKGQSDRSIWSTRTDSICVE